MCFLLTVVWEVFMPCLVVLVGASHCTMKHGADLPGSWQASTVTRYVNI